MKTVISTDAAPAAIGPYSQAIRAGGVLYTSGQVALDAKTGAMVGATVAEQAEKVMQNLAAVLEAGGATFDNVVRCTIYLIDLEQFAAVNAVYAKYMPTPPPARACIEVSRLPKDALVEIDAIAYLG
ncbi:MAG: 2-iminobutanoate/2-iminopropanoate deaminase [Bradymonadia bacterium]|jgi:2-iminobutanoate/2-iminopropanoate deaminase